jgi:uncharacterized protein YpiB (UPF0302 family)
MERGKRVFVQFLIDPEKKQKFAGKVEQEGRKMTDVLLEWIDNYLDETEKVDVVELSKRLETLEKIVGVEKVQLLGESAA